MARSLLVGRRELWPLAALAAAGASACGRPVRAKPDAALPSDLTLLVAGPPSGPTDGWATVLLPALSRSFPAGTRLDREVVGAADGVTGANQFETRTAPDGSTALLLPGSAILAWMVGDPRAQFDAARWVMTLASMAPAVLASRIPLARIGPGARVRVAAGGPAGHDLPALLGLELLGAEVVPVFDAGTDAVLSGEADATLLRGRTVLPAVQACAAAGAPPVLALGSWQGRGQPARDPGFPDVPSLTELLGPPSAAPLIAALHAAATAAQIDTEVVLPKLTPAGAVAVWRYACAQAAAAPEVQTEAARLGLRTLATPNAAAFAVNAPALLELRRWLSARFAWNPS